MTTFWHRTTAALTLTTLGVAALLCLLLGAGRSTADPDMPSGRMVALASLQVGLAGDHVSSTGARPGISAGIPVSASGSGRHSFGIHVRDVTGLYPGRRVQLRLIFRNPYAQSISVTDVTVRVRGHFGCRRGRFYTGTYTFDDAVVVPTSGKTRARVPFGMRYRVRDYCQADTVQVVVRAEAVRS